MKNANPMNMKCWTKPTRCHAWALLGLLLGSTSLPAAPRDEVLRLVPEDVGLCMLVQDLRGHLAALAESPFVAQLRGSAVGKALLAAPELTQLAQIDRFIKETVGADWAQLRDDILGDAVVFAYRPGPPGKAEQEQALLLVRARSGPALAKLADRLNTVQKQLGDLKELQERQHQGVKYFRRVEQKYDPYFYYLDGPILAVSSHENILRQSIDLLKKEAPAELSWTKQLKQLKADQALLAVWIKPRAFDADLAERAKSPIEAEAAFVKTYLSWWKVLDSVVFSVSVQRHVEVNLGLQARTEALSPPARKLLAGLTQPSPLWGAFPDNALFAVAGRIDVGAFLDVFGEFLTEETRKSVVDALDQAAGPALGKVIRDVVRSCGPDWGTCIVAPAAGDKAWFPQVITALRVQPGPGPKPADQTLLDAINFFTGLAIFDHNSKHDDRISLKTVVQDKVEVKYLVQDKIFPPGLQPAYALKEGFLLLGSSPEAVQLFRLAGSPVSGEEVPVFRSSLAALRTYLTERREPLAASITEKQQLTRQEAGQRLDNLVAALQFFDKIELTQRPSPNQVILTLRVYLAQPLRK